jgi:hypothetical protein
VGLGVGFGVGGGVGLGVGGGVGLGVGGGVVLGNELITSIIPRYFGVVRLWRSSVNPHIPYLKRWIY